MKELLILLLKVAICTVTVALGFALGNLLGMPIYLVPIVLLPAGYLIEKLLGGRSMSFIEAFLFAGVLGFAIWMTRDLVSLDSPLTMFMLAGVMFVWITEGLKSWRLRKKN